MNIHLLKITADNFAIMQNDIRTINRIKIINENSNIGLHDVSAFISYDSIEDLINFDKSSLKYDRSTLLRCLLKQAETKAYIQPRMGYGILRILHSG